MFQCVALAVLLLVPAAARADAVGPADPGVVCPAGSTVSVDHCGTVCTARRCASDGDCRDGEECAAVRLCAEDVPYCGGWTSDPYEQIRGACDEGCAGDEDCRSFDACVPREGSDDGGSPADAGDGEVVTYGCGCRAGGRAVAHPSLALLGLAALWVRRRA